MTFIFLIYLGCDRSIETAEENVPCKDKTCVVIGKGEKTILSVLFVFKRVNANRSREKKKRKDGILRMKVKRRKLFIC